MAWAWLRALSVGLGIVLVVGLLTACGGGGDGGERSVEPELVVNSNADVAERDGVLTLREAILLATGEASTVELDSGEVDQVHGEPGAQSADLISFEGAFQGEGAIVLSSPLPPLAGGGDTIDGSAAGGVVISGAARSLVCLEINSSENALRGLQIMECRSGILLSQEAHENLIGGTGKDEGNVVSGNVVGIELRGAKNVIQGNLIGVDASGALAMGNEFEGIWITPVARDNLIGGVEPGAGNVISGNELFGISVDGAADNVLQGNLIGLDRSGTQPVGNRYGIVVQAGAKGNLLGGRVITERNVISGSNIGLLLRDGETRDNIVRGNYFGTDASGVADVANVVDLWEGEIAGQNVIEDNRLRERR